MKLEIDWTRCDGHGMCAALLPGRIALDEWGFPHHRRRARPPRTKKPTCAARSASARPWPCDWKVHRDDRTVTRMDDVDARR